MASADLHCICHLVNRQVKLLGQFLWRRTALVLLFKLGESLAYLIERANLIERQTYYTALFGQSLKDALTYPPYRITDELETTGLIEFLSSLDKTKVALIDEVRQTESLILILLGYRNDKAEVGSGEFLKSMTTLLATFAYLRSKFNFFFNCD